MQHGVSYAHRLPMTLDVNAHKPDPVRKSHAMRGFNWRQRRRLVLKEDLSGEVRLSGAKAFNKGISL